MIKQASRIIAFSTGMILGMSYWGISQVKFQESYYKYNWRETEGKDDASFYSVIRSTDSGWTRVDYFLHSKKMLPQMIGLFKDKDSKIHNGTFRWYYANGAIERYGRYAENQKVGLWLDWFSNGVLADSGIYDHGNRTGISLSWYNTGYTKDSLNLDANGNGIYVSWFDDGAPAEAGRYVGFNKKHGKWQYFYKNGRLSSTELYDRGQLTAVQVFDKEGNFTTDTSSKDSEAVFPGGDKAWQKYLSKNLRWPSNIELINTDHVVVVVSAVINDEGKVIDAEVSVPFHAAFDKIALDAVKSSPAWIPAVEHNRNVYGKLSVPVEFGQSFN